MAEENVVNVIYEWQYEWYKFQSNKLPENPIEIVKSKMNYVCSIIEKNRNGNLVLDMSGELEYSVNIAKEIIYRLNLKKEEFKLIFSHNIVDDDFSNYYNIEVNHLGNCNWSNFYKKLCARKIDWQNIILKHYFLSLANRPSITRALYTKSLLEHFNKESLISLGSTSDVKIKNILHPYKTPIRIDFDSNLSIKQCSDVPNSIIFETLFNIVHEANPPEFPEIYITEKTFKAFAWHQIPIFITNKNVINMLRNFGFDLFDDILEHHVYSSNFKLHHLKVMSLLKRLTQKYKNLEELQQLRTDVFFRLSYNNDLLSKVVMENKYDIF